MNENTQLTLRSELEGSKFKAAIAQLLPKILTPERFVRVSILAMTRNPKLAQCDRKSFFNALLTLSQLGLEPDGRRAHLIPFENKKRETVECQLIVDYKGLAELVLRSGEVVALHADVVRENDEFEHDRGIVTRHTYKLGKPRGEIIGAYSTAKTRGGAEMAKVMTLEEILEVRDGSQGYQAFKKGYAKSSPWETSFAEMAKKTPFKQLSKWLPLSPDAKVAIENEDGKATTPSKPDGSPVFDLGPDDVSDVSDDEPKAELDKKKPVTDEVRMDFPTKKSAPDQLAEELSKAGYGWDDLCVWGKAKNVFDPKNADGFDTMDQADAKRLVRVLPTIIAEMNEMKGGAK